MIHPVRYTEPLLDPAINRHLRELNLIEMKNIVSLVYLLALFCKVHLGTSEKHFLEDFLAQRNRSGWIYLRLAVFMIRELINSKIAKCERKIAHHTYQDRRTPYDKKPVYLQN